jgi:hypothetical protein
MRKRLPKRRDLRKRIARLEKENAWLKSKLRVREVAVSRYPVTFVSERYYRLPGDEIISGELLRKSLIQSCAYELSKNATTNVAEITETDRGNGWHTISMKLTVIPSDCTRSDEIQEAIEGIKREDSE